MSDSDLALKLESPPVCKFLKPSLRRVIGLLTICIIPCAVWLFILDTLYRFDSLVKAMPFHDLLVTISAMFLILLTVGMGLVFAGVGVALLTWPLREKLLRAVRLLALVFLVLITSRAAFHWLLKITGFEYGNLGQWATLLLGVPVPSAIVLTSFYVLVFLTVTLWLLKARRLEVLLKEFETIGREFTKATLMIAAIPAMICGYHLFTVAGTREFPVCDTSAQAPSNISIPTSTQHKNALPDIVLVTFDALTARDMSLHGYGLPTTPGMERLAQESYMYEQAISVSNWTKPGVVSILTGQYPHRHRLFSSLSDAIVLQHPDRTLPHLLRDMGYRTTAVVSNASFGHPMVNGTYRSFDVCAWDAFAPGFLEGNILRQLRHKVRNTIGVILLDHNIYVSGWLDDFLNSFPAFRFWQLGVLWNERSTAPPERTFAVAKQAILETSKQPKFVWTHVYSPHSPYIPDEKYRGRFLPGDEFRTSTSQGRVLVFYPTDMQKTVDQLRLRYDEYILNADQAFADFIGFLKKSGRWENTLLIVSADHGESFEDGVRHHRGEYLYQQLIHIPLLIHLPGQQEGFRIDAAASQVDIAPTILNYLKTPAPSWMDGEALGLGGKEPKAYRYSMEIEANGTRLPINKGIVVATDGRYKLAYSLTHDSLQLFDLKADPDESKNIAAENGAIVERMRAALMNEIKR